MKMNIIPDLHFGESHFRDDTDFDLQVDKIVQFDNLTQMHVLIEHMDRMFRDMGDKLGFNHIDSIWDKNQFFPHLTEALSHFANIKGSSEQKTGKDVEEWYHWAIQLTDCID